MDAIILAAGKGTRLRPYTETCPKPLLDVQGRPILDWILGALPRVSKLIIVVNYLAEQIEEYMQKQTHCASWITVRQNSPLGTGDALMSCRDHCNADRVMVLNGDDLIGRQDLQQLAQVSAGILVHQVDHPEAFGIVMENPDGTLESIVEKPTGLTPPQWANIGGYVFPKSVFDLTLTKSPRGEYEITEAVDLIARKQPFHVVHASYWLPIGDIPQWHAAQQTSLDPVRSS